MRAGKPSRQPAKIQISCPPLPVGAGVWDLPTGSQLVYTPFYTRSKPPGLPVLFLHGGPGASAVAGWQSYTGLAAALNTTGHDFYLYDQLGSGYSTRLIDPVGYTVDRHVADLAAVREAIGAGQVILIGESWGAVLAVNFMARYPQRVAKVVFISPGAMDPTEWDWWNLPGSPFIQAHQGWEKQFWRTPRRMALAWLMNIDLAAAHRYAPDHELDPLYTAAIHQQREILVCDRRHGRAARLPELQMGWWCAKMTNRDLARRSFHPRRLLAGGDGQTSLLRQSKNDFPAANTTREVVNRLPALVLRGENDYIRKAVALQYLSTFPNSELVHVPAAGHLVAYEQPESLNETIAMFIRQDKVDPGCAQ